MVAVHLQLKDTFSASLKWSAPVRGDSPLQSCSKKSERYTQIGIHIKNLIVHWLIYPPYTTTRHKVQNRPFPDLSSTQSFANLPPGVFPGQLGGCLTCSCHYGGKSATPWIKPDTATCLCSCFPQKQQVCTPCFMEPYYRSRGALCIVTVKLKIGQLFSGSFWETGI